MKTAKDRKKVIVHETREESKVEEHHFVGNKDLIKEIEKKAYEIYENRGYAPGRELEDWLEAEKLVTAEEPR